MTNKKNTFRKKWRTLTELGNEFGVSAVKFGSLLKKHGLREPTGEPSQLAIAGGYVEHIEPKQGKSYYLWHRQKTSDFLVENGVEKAGVSSQEAEKMTEARKLARSYMEALELDEEGSKLGYMIMDDLIPEIKKIGLARFNQALKAVGYKGEEVNLED